MGQPKIKDAALDESYSLKHFNVNTQVGTAYTLQLTDDGNIVEMDNVSPNTITVPPNSSIAFPIGAKIDLVQYGTGTTTVVEGSGVTINSVDTLVFDGQFAGATVYKRGTDEWVLTGKMVQ